MLFNSLLDVLDNHFRFWCGGVFFFLIKVEVEEMGFLTVSITTRVSEGMVTNSALLTLYTWLVLGSCRKKEREN